VLNFLVKFRLAARIIRRGEKFHVAVMTDKLRVAVQTFGVRGRLRTVQEELRGCRQRRTIITGARPFGAHQFAEFFLADQQAVHKTFHGFAILLQIVGAHRIHIGDDAIRGFRGQQNARAFHGIFSAVPNRTAGSQHRCIGRNHKRSVDVALLERAHRCVVGAGQIRQPAQFHIGNRQSRVAKNLREVVDVRAVRLQCDRLTT